MSTISGSGAENGTECTASAPRSNMERALDFIARHNVAAIQREHVEMYTPDLAALLAALLDEAERRGESRILDMANGQPAVMVSGSGSSLVVSYGYPGKPEEGK
jgi:hypothetical protein